jgi:hypothetical protein
MNTARLIQTTAALTLYGMLTAFGSGSQVTPPPGQSISSVYQRATTVQSVAGSSAPQRRQLQPIGPAQHAEVDRDYHSLS